jgi:hypothetical protein
MRGGASGLESAAVFFGSTEILRHFPAISADFARISLQFSLNAPILVRLPMNDAGRGRTTKPSFSSGFIGFSDDFWTSVDVAGSLSSACCDRGARSGCMPLWWKPKTPQPKGFTVSMVFGCAIRRVDSYIYRSELSSRDAPNRTRLLGELTLWLKPLPFPMR